MSYICCDIYKIICRGHYSCLLPFSLLLLLVLKLLHVIALVTISIMINVSRKVAVLEGKDPNISRGQGVYRGYIEDF